MSTLEPGRREKKVGNPRQPAKGPDQNQQDSDAATIDIAPEGGIKVGIHSSVENFTVIGKIEKFIRQVINPPELRRIGHEQRVGFWTVGLLIVIIAVVSLMIARSPRTLEPMSGGFNIAIAEFGLVDQQHNAADSPDLPKRGKGLAKQVTLQLQQELTASLSATNTAGNFLVWGPDDGVRRVQGQTDAARQADALHLLKSIKADVLLYGDLIVEYAQTSFKPVLCISERTLQDAEEQEGCYPMGSLQRAGNVLRNPMADEELSEMLKQRLLGGTQGMTQFIYGLGNFAENKREAADYFAEAISQAETTQADPKMLQVLYLFAAKSWHELAAQQLTDKDRIPFWDKAQLYYKKALDVSNQQYARAWLGYADIEFQLARGDCQPGHTNPISLTQAITDYQRALTATDQTEASNIEAKTAFYLGRAFSCESAAGFADHWSKAMSETVKARDLYSKTMKTKGTTVAADLERYAEASGMLGLICWKKPRPDLRAAVQAYQEAIDFTSKNYLKAIYHSQLASIFEQMADYWQAGVHWERAKQCAPEQLDSLVQQQRAALLKRRADIPILPTATLPPQCQ